MDKDFYIEICINIFIKKFLLSFKIKKTKLFKIKFDNFICLAELNKTIIALKFLIFLKFKFLNCFIIIVISKTIIINCNNKL